MNTFATTAPITTVLDIPLGRIHLIAADRDDTVVEVLPADPSKKRDAKAVENTAVEYANGVLKIFNTEPGKLGNPGAVEVTIQLPSGSSVQGKTAVTDLRGVGRLGDVTLDTAQGTMKLDETAAAQLSIAQGTITVGRVNGDSSVTVQQGDINVTDAAGGNLTLSTQVGSITVATAPGVSATLDAGTTHGRVSNSLKNDGTPAVTIKATTASGDITASSK